MSLVVAFVCAYYMPSYLCIRFRYLSQQIHRIKHCLLGVPSYNIYMCLC